MAQSLDFERKTLVDKGQSQHLCYLQTKNIHMHILCPLEGLG
jgi:hypothetical protein